MLTIQGDSKSLVISDENLCRSFKVILPTKFDKASFKALNAPLIVYDILKAGKYFYIITDDSLIISYNVFNNNKTLSEQLICKEIFPDVHKIADEDLIIENQVEKEELKNVVKILYNHILALTHKIEKLEDTFKEFERKLK